MILSNSSSLRLDFPTITFPNVSRRDNGNYTLVATNYRLDDPAVEIGTGTRSFKLNVLCKLSLCFVELVSLSIQKK